jgi:hypothetical protein
MTSNLYRWTYRFAILAALVVAAGAGQKFGG